MIVRYKLSETDYLNNQLFIASRSERIKRKRRNSLIIVPVAYLALAIFGFLSISNSMGIAFVILSLLWCLLYPKYQAKKYYNHYKSHIAENYKELCETEVTMEIREDVIVCSDSKAESKLKINAIGKIFELPTVYLLNINKASNIVMPRNDQVSAFINILITQHDIELHDFISWNWK